MQDALGRVLELGDFVAVTTGHYKILTLCQVIDFTPQKVRVQCLEEDYNYAFYWSKNKVVDPAQLVKVEL